VDIGNIKCPVCGKVMTPVACKCNACDIRMEGEFSTPVLSRLTPEDQALIIAFIRAFGSIKKIQELLGVSYPTARSRIAELVKKLDSAMESSSNRRDHVIDKLYKGEITFEKALEEL